jgi:nicotinamide riboside kinase
MTLRIALLGAECTGKSSLTQMLGQALTPAVAATVTEYLREWCLREQRTPLQHEQEAIAAEQTRRIHAAALTHRLVVADTTALMTAVYSVHYFADASLLPAAIEAQRQFDLTFLCCPEGIPWQADGWLRDGNATRLNTHAELQALLRDQGLAYTLLQGSLTTRLDRALAAIHNLPQ